MFIEVEEFSLKSGVEVSTFRALDAGVQGWSHLHRRHVLRRTAAITDDAEVIVITLIGGTEPPEPPDGAAAPVRALSDSMNEASYRRRVYHDLGG